MLTVEINPEKPRPRHRRRARTELVDPRLAHLSREGAQCRRVTARCASRSQRAPVHARGKVGFSSPAPAQTYRRGKSHRWLELAVRQGAMTAAIWERARIPPRPALRRDTGKREFDGPDVAGSKDSASRKTMPRLFTVLPSTK